MKAVHGLVWSNSTQLSKPLLLMLVLIICGCASQLPELQLESSQRELEQARQSQHPAPKIPELVSDALLTPLAPAAPQPLPEEPQEHFDIAVDSMPARQFFLSLVQGTGVNIVVHPEVTGDISLELRDVVLDDVMRVVRDIYGYEFKQQQDIYTVYPRKLRTEIFHINYLDIQRVGVSDTSVLIGEIRNEDSDSNTSNTSSNSSSGILSALEGGDGSSALDSSGDSRQLSVNTGETRVQTLSQTDFWGGLRQTLLAMIGGEQGQRLVVVTPQAGLVVVRAMPGELNAVREYLEISQLSVRRQVILEAKIIEVELHDSHNSGINWSALSGQIHYLNNITAFSGGSSGNFEFAEIGELFTTVIGSDDITQLLNLLSTQGNVQVLSSPRISTVNNQKAIIKVGSDEFFVTGVRNTTTATTSSVSSTPDVEMASFFSGIALDVTPQIAADGEIILHVHPVISNVTDQQKDLVVGDESFSLPLALRDIRESDSVVRARSGQVVVLGGLMQETNNNLRGQHPGLASIPLLGAAFRSRQDLSKKTELVILLKPTVADSHAWQQQVQQSQQRLQQMQKGL